MEDFVNRSLLYDFYGELLTEHQREVYRAIVFEDYSVSEVARDEGVSRQSIHDLMKRCDRILEEYEEKLQLVGRFLRIRERVSRIRELNHGKDRKIDSIAQSILDEL